MKKNYSEWLMTLGCIVLLAVTGCSRDKKGLVVAKVDGRKITAGDLAAFTEAMPRSYRTKKVGLEGHKDHLQTMIDRDLLLIEAEDRGLDKGEEFRENLQKILNEKLLEEFERREISEKIKVSDEEARKRFEETGLNRSVRIAHIATKTEQDAQAASAEIKAGKPFEEVVKKWSTDKKSIDKKGDLEDYFTHDKGIPVLRKKVFSMKVGEISEPIRVPNGYEIIKVLDERPVDFEAYKGKMSHQVYERKFRDQRDALVEELKVKYSPRLRPEVVPFLAQHWSRIDTIALGDDGKRVVYDWKGREVTIRNLVQAMGTRVRWTRLDSNKVRMFVETLILPKVLLLEAAHRAKIDKDRKVREWADAKRDELLMEVLRSVEVENKVQTTDEECRQEYEKHKMDLYSIPPTVKILEIFVKTEGEANALLSMIRKGGDMEQIAVESTAREWAKQYKCIFHFHPFEKARFGEEIVKAAFGAEVGQLVGPLKAKEETQEGYSIFKVLEKMPQQPEPFEQVRKRVEATTRGRKADEMFERFVRSLRAKYASKIRIDDDHLRKAAAAGVLTTL